MATKVRKLVPLRWPLTLTGKFAIIKTRLSNVLLFPSTIFLSSTEAQDGSSLSFYTLSLLSYERLYQW